MPLHPHPRRLAPRVIAAVALALLPIACASPAAPDRASAGAPCVNDVACPPSEGACLWAVCRAGRCTTTAVIAGVVSPIQVPGDCKRIGCDAQGKTFTWPDPEDRPPADVDVCTEEICVGDQPGHRSIAAGTPCGDRKVCSATGTCGSCIPGQKRCGASVVEVCGARGEWEHESECAGSCSNGVCTPFVAIAPGDGHTCGRFVDGSVACWGNCASGQLGRSFLPHDGPDRALPQRVPTLEDVSDVALGNEHACALRGDGSVACWGSNEFGQLGDGTHVARTVPVAPVGITRKVKQIAAGELHTCALLDDGGVRCWGKNDEGQLGDGSVDNVLERTFHHETPAFTKREAHRVWALDAVTLIRSRGSRTCALERGGTVACWGTPSDHGRRIPEASKLGKPRAVRVRPLGDVKALALGEAHSCALLRDGTVRCWGNNEVGQLGDGTTRNRTSPVPVKGLTGVESLSATTDSTCARLGDGSVRCWGGHRPADREQVTTKADHLPFAIPDLRDAKDLVVGGGRGCATRASGAIACWGYSTYGEVGTSLPTSPPTSPAAISIGEIVP